MREIHDCVICGTMAAGEGAMLGLCGSCSAAWRRFQARSGSEADRSDLWYMPPEHVRILRWAARRLRICIDRGRGRGLR